MELEPRYDASRVESSCYDRWTQSGYFKELPGRAGAPKFTITIPPPNITGALHMGHSLCYPIQDTIARFKRLLGYDVLVVPGQDHAGIATQSVVSKQLKSQGINPSELGREKFIEKTWEWRKVSGDTIIKQFQSLGCSFDWDRLRFTLDDDYAHAVLSVFVSWYERGLIYRGKRVINWDPVLQTSVSDIETERQEIRGKLYHVRYPFADGSGEVVIATTRPETMLGDVAVAVNPSDKRYEGQVGKMLKLPLQDREIPLIADPYPDPEFGTGAVKITPAHDPNDYEVGVRNGLEMPVIMDLKANIIAEGPYLGMNRFDCRKQLVNDLEEAGFLVEIEDYTIPIIRSERSGEIIEPLLSEQWFVKQTELAQPGIDAVKSGKIKFHPERYSKVYLDWMENIRDWCISRQLWWGHRIPVYYTADGQAFAATSWDEAQAKAGELKIVRQDEDVLDTWFSSGLWPFAVLGWPNAESQELKERYPTSVLVTDRNIIYLWVARMIMMGLDFVGEIPFKDVCIHATVMTEDGKRMSKSLGTGVDPTQVIEKIGADALRHTLISQAGTNQEIRYSEKRTEESRNFCNKMWNAVRFVLMNLDGQAPTRPTTFEVEDEWLLTRLAETEFSVRAAYERYDFQQAAMELYRFFWGDFCDRYIEITKSRLADPAQRNTPQWVLIHAARSYCIMHPIMPFITEELYRALPVEGKLDSVMLESWPETDAALVNQASLDRVERWFNMVRAIRSLRADLAIDPKKGVDTVYFKGDLDGGEAVIQSQAWVVGLSSEAPSGVYVSTTAEDCDFHIVTEGLVDVPKLRSKIEGELVKSRADILGLERKFENPQFVERAKPEIVERDRALLEELQGLVVKLEERLGRLG
jgi:valyl-tRNA synthetase